MAGAARRIVVAGDGRGVARHVGRSVASCGPLQGWAASGRIQTTHTQNVLSARSSNALRHAGLWTDAPKRLPHFANISPRSLLSDVRSPAAESDQLTKLWPDLAELRGRRAEYVCLMFRGASRRRISEYFRMVCRCSLSIVAASAALPGVLVHRKLSATRRYNVAQSQPLAVLRNARARCIIIGRRYPPGACARLCQAWRRRAGNGDSDREAACRRVPLATRLRHLNAIGAAFLHGAVGGVADHGLETVRCATWAMASGHDPSRGTQRGTSAQVGFGRQPHGQETRSCSGFPAPLGKGAARWRSRASGPPCLCLCREPSHGCYAMARPSPKSAEQWRTSSGPLGRAPRPAGGLGSAETPPFSTLATARPGGALSAAGTFVAACHLSYSQVLLPDLSLIGGFPPLRRGAARSAFVLPTWGHMLGGPVSRSWPRPRHVGATMSKYEPLRRPTGAVHPIARAPLACRPLLAATPRWRVVRAAHPPPPPRAPEARPCSTSGVAPASSASSPRGRDPSTESGVAGGGAPSQERPSGVPGS